MRTVIFRDQSASIEVFDLETQQSEFFDSLSEVLRKYKNLNFLTIKNNQ